MTRGADFEGDSIFDVQIGEWKNLSEAIFIAKAVRQKNNAEYIWVDKLTRFSEQ